MRKGMIVDVYRRPDGYDCTNRGASSRIERFTLTGNGVPKLFAPTPERPEMVLITENARDEGRAVPRVVPRELVDSGAWTMFGGNFVYSSDSRFPSDAPIKVFDRVE